MAVKSETQIARQLFLYGAGDGKRVISVRALCEATGLHEQTIGKHMPKWVKEAEEILMNSNEGGLGLALSKKTLDAHNADMDFLRNEINSIKWEMENLNDSIAALENICENFSLNSDNGDAALRIFENYLRASMNKSSLRGQFLGAEKRWVELSGVVAMSEVQITREKTLAQGRAKLDLKREENQAGIRDSNGPISGVFARPNRSETAAD